MSIELKEGDKVRYVPSHAHANVEHKDCEDGVVTTIRDKSIWVRFGSDTHAKLCAPELLVKLD